MPVEKIKCVVSCSAEADSVWAIASDFCSAWHPSIAVMNTEYSLSGALIRAFSVHGEDTVYREQLTYYSDTEQQYAYKHIEGIAEVECYHATFKVEHAGNEGCTITMAATVTAEAPRSTEIATGTRAIFDLGLGALAKLAEKSEPAIAEHLQRQANNVTPIQTVMIDGGPSIAVDVVGDANAPLCLFLHGIGGNRDNWAPQLQAVAPTMRAAAMDFRGYGDSQSGSVQSTVDDYCDDILRVCNALGAEKLVLCGLSYGAWIATSFALRHPEKLRALVLSGGCTGMSEAEAAERNAFRDSRVVPLDAGQVPADFAPAVVDVLAGPGASDACRQGLFDSMAAISPETYRDALVCFTNPPERFDFSGLAMPVLMMTGEYDRLAPPEQIKSVAQRIAENAVGASVRYETIINAGHVCNVEDPQQYNAVLLQFLQNLPLKSGA